MWAEFKEKTFETAFVGELRLLTNIIYAPDQCDEALLGFDASAFVPWELLPPILPYMRFRRWRRLIGVSSTEIRELGNELNSTLPKFRLNLFIQFKRPEYLTRSSATEWSYWERNYFRYSVGDKQQKLLRKIVDVGASRAAVVYAVPAFHKSDELFTHQVADAIIENSNILNAALLSGHSRCTFTEAGNFGVGHSDPEEIRSQSLEEIIRTRDGMDELPFTQHVKSTADGIKVLFEDDDEGRNTLGLARRAIIGGELSEIYPRAEGTWLDAIVTMVAFSSAFGVRICALG